MRIPIEMTYAPNPPQLITGVFNSSGDTAPLEAKILTSSASRSHFSGATTLLRESAAPVYRMPRTGTVEHETSPPLRSDKLAWDRYPEVLHDWIGSSRPDEEQWIIIADSAGVVLRNIDHLLPTGSSPDFDAEFYWATAPDNGARGKVAATPGLCAVKGRSLPVLLERWAGARDRPRSAGEDSCPWAEVVADLPLRKRAFEKGEVYAPRPGAVDWTLLAEAAFVTVPDWPAKERWKFLQALYFGTYFGDDTGLMLSILDP